MGVGRLVCILSIAAIYQGGKLRKAVWMVGDLLDHHREGLLAFVWRWP
jgi:hypothetical protein